MTNASPINGPVTTGQSALKYELTVSDQGRLQLDVPLAAGARVVVFVVPETDDAVSDLVAAAESSLSFWDNALDDEDWNDA